MAVDEGLRIELPADEGISPVDRDGLRREGLHQHVGGVAYLAAFLEGDGEFAAGQEGLLFRDDSLPGIVEWSGSLDGLVSAQALEEEFPLRRGFVQAVPETAETAFAADVARSEIGLVVHLGKTLAVEIVAGKTEVAVAQRDIVQADGIVAEIEIGCDVFPGAEDPDAVVAQMAFPVVREEHIVRFLAQFHLIVLQEQTVDQAFFRGESRFEIRKGDFDQFTHCSYAWTSCW